MTRRAAGSGPAPDPAAPLSGAVRGPKSMSTTQPGPSTPDGADRDPGGPLRLGVFGGSFDPVHEGHVELVRRAQEAFGLERVHWVPARRPPHKLDRVLASDTFRYAMTLIATIGEPSWEVLTLELTREGPSYTYDTLLEIEDRARPLVTPKKDGGKARRRRELELYLIIGSDNLPGLPGWKNAEDVLRIARPIVVWRGGQTPAEHVAALAGRLPEEAVERICEGFIELPPLPYSSTEVREALAQGQVPEGALHHEVLEFLVEKGLYDWPDSVPCPPDPRPPVVSRFQPPPDPEARPDPGIRRRARRDGP
ncbi:MAG: nicotinate-nucleotide adenylyltransferase [Planctomycetota bacterium]